MTTPVYLDHHATTPLDSRVFDAMLPWWTQQFGNPHSVDHAYGWAAEEAVEAARRQVAALVGAEAREIVFTSGATEANNLAILGLLGHEESARKRIVVSPIEHKCVLQSCAVRLQPRKKVLPSGLELTKISAAAKRRGCPPA